MSLASQTPSGIAYDRRGPTDRIPLVLLHAGIADRRMWNPQWEELTASRDTVRLDLRGFGGSTRRPAGALDHVADVIDTIEGLDITRCHLVGSSFGAGVATELALTRPGLVRSLVLCPPGGSLLAELTPALRSFFDTEKEALARDDVDAAVEANVTTWVVGPRRREPDVDPAVVAAVRQMQRNTFDIAASWGEVEEVELEPPALDRLADLDLPLLVLVGGHDLDTTHDAADRICAGAPHTTRVDWADSAHLPSMEKAKPFLELLLHWTDAHDHPPARPGSPPRR
jgi:pimeloyl-ACP methyl ester carboxylesterase